MSNALPIFVLNRQLFTNQSLSSTVSSDIVDLAETLGYAIHAIWTGAPVGDISVQGGNDGINFVEIDSVATGGVSGQHLLNVEKHHYRYVRIQYISTSGTGSLTLYISGKRG